MSGSFTLVLGPRLGELAHALAAGQALTAPEDRCADAFTRSLLRALCRAHLERDVVLWLRGPGPALSTHQRRSLERVAQGARPAALLEAGHRPPAWAAGLPAAFAEGPSGGPPPARPGAALASNNHLAKALAARLGALRPANPGPGTGSWRPGGALLVGDRPNPRSAGAGFPPWPFASQLREGCSAWLSEHLEAAGVPEARLYWVNAYARSGESNGSLAELARRLQPRVVVALGKHAADALAREGVANVQVHHPQHWKRFHAHHRYVLGRVLARALGP